MKFFNADKGFGFIKPEDGGRDVFVHARPSERNGLPQLKEGRRVGFDVAGEMAKPKRRICGCCEPGGARRKRRAGYFFESLERAIVDPQHGRRAGVFHLDPAFYSA